MNATRGHSLLCEGHLVCHDHNMMSFPHSEISLLLNGRVRLILQGQRQYGRWCPTIFAVTRKMTESGSLKPFELSIAMWFE